MLSARRSVLGLLLCSACSSKALFVEPPPDPEAHAALLAVIGPPTPALFAHPLAVGAAIEIEMERGHELHALTYSQTLAELGLELGPVRVVAPEDPVGRLVPDVRREFAMRSDDPAPAWATIEDSPARHLYIPRIPPHCTELDFHTINVDGVSLPMQSPPFHLTPEGRVVLGNRFGDMYELIDDHLVRLNGAPAAVSGWASPDGRIWLASEHELVSTRLVGNSFSPPQVVYTSSVAIKIVEGEPTASGELSVLFATSRGEVLRYRAGVVSSLFMTGRIPIELQPLGDDNVALFDWSRRVTVLENGQTETLLLDPGVNVETILAAPELGLVVATSDGDLIRREGGGWVSLLARSYGFAANDVIAFEGGLLTGLASGFLVQFQEGIDPCEPIQTTLLAFKTELFLDGRDVIGLVTDTADKFLAFRLTPTAR